MADKSSADRLPRLPPVLKEISNRILRNSDESLEKKKATEEFIKSTIKQHDGKEPTDSYGEIEFGGSTSSTAKYVKVGKDTKVEDLYTLLTTHWGLKIPNLIISVTGGAKNFTLRTRLKEVFRKTLIKASESTGAWITTGGTHAGVMKHVGKAVKHYAAIRDDKDRVVTIGIATWGVIHERDKLVNSKDTPQAPKVYDAEEAEQKKNAILDSNHSHFILVDDGSAGEYGKEIALRTNLERYIGKGISTINGAEERDAMIVCVIVQGGPGSLETVRGSIENDTPVVIVGGSEGWAGVLAAATTEGYNDEKPIGEDVVTLLMRDNKMKTVGEETNITKWTKAVNECISKPKLLTLFTLDPNDTSKGLDIAILKALLKAPSSENLSNGTKRQLELAMKWNRSDIARSDILDEDTSIKKEDIADIFFKALKANKHEFCKVLLDYGVDLKKHFTVEKLMDLYKSTLKESVWHGWKNVYSPKEEFSKKIVRRIMEKCLGHSYLNIYEEKKDESYYFLETAGKIDDPYREIFQWAILMNYRETARHIWEYMYESMAAAIMATKILKKMEKKMSHNHDKRSQMLADASEYEALAAGILGKCFAENTDKTIPLLIASLPKWGGFTCLQIAVKANDMHFVSQPGVQFFLEKLWMDELDPDTCTLKILALGFSYPLIVILKKCSGKGKGRSSKVGAADSLPATKHDVETGSACSGCVQGLGNFYEEITTFYNAPIVKFWMNVVFFLFFLGVFAFVILSDFNMTVTMPSGWEDLIFVWMTSLFLEAIREFVGQEAGNFCKTLWIYITDAWHIMDLASMGLFYVGFGMRFYTHLLHISLILYSFAFMIQCIRIVHIFAVHRVLGPKIIMVGKMLKDLLFFLFIFIVFLLAYGIASQALLYPSETSFWSVFVGIIYKPYWQIYGELFLNEIDYNPNLGDYTCSDTDANLPRCPQQNEVVPILSAVYLLFANILLLNLLIAMFSYTFETVEKRSNEIWMFQRYKLIAAYRFRPALVPPLIVISQVKYFVLKLYARWTGEDDSFYELKIKWNKEEQNAFAQLQKWEHWHAEAFTREKHEKDDLKAERQLQKLSNRIDNIMSTVEELQARQKTQ